jgi:putative methionine-R-sulfoxide reductase with GAF domain
VQLLENYYLIKSLILGFCCRSGTFTSILNSTFPCNSHKLSPSIIITEPKTKTTKTPSNPPSPSNFSNTSSLLWHAYHSLPAPSNHVNWAGFYFTDPTHSTRLLLGPFQGQVACQTIAFNRGVCGTAAATQTTQLVADVEQFPGHIACDGASRSEIVVPVVQGGKVRFFSL